LNNGKSTGVRITTRPFVDNRIIDLSLAAAREVDRLAQALCPWRVEVSRVDPTAVFLRCKSGFPRPHQRRAVRDRPQRHILAIFISNMIRRRGFLSRARRQTLRRRCRAPIRRAKLHGREGFTPFVTRLDEFHPQEQPMSADCLFCKIAAKKIPSTMVYEDPISSPSRTSAPRRPHTSSFARDKHFESLNDAATEDQAVLGKLH